jgi:hypothetical protein
MNKFHIFGYDVKKVYSITSKTSAGFFAFIKSSSPAPSNVKGQFFAFF